MRALRTTVVGLSCVVLNVACTPERDFDRAGSPSIDPTPIAIEAVLETPEAYVGRKMTLGGEIVDVWSERVFSIVGQQFLENDRLLVVTQAAAPADRAGVADPGARVRVTGTLENGADETLQRKLRIDLSPVPGRLREPVFVAESVSIAPPL